MITDKAITEQDAQVLAYGKLQTAADFSQMTGEGEGSFTLPDVGENYKIYLLAEDLGEGNRTDTATAPIEVGELEKGSTDVKEVAVTGLDTPKGGPDGGSGQQQAGGNQDKR